jgi:hypothetical protein
MDAVTEYASREHKDECGYRKTSTVQQIIEFFKENYEERLARGRGPLDHPP